MAALRVGVGSENAAKLRSVRMACELVFPGREIQVVGVKVTPLFHVIVVLA